VLVHEIEFVGGEKALLDGLAAFFNSKFVTIKVLEATETN